MHMTVIYKKDRDYHGKCPRCKDELPVEQEKLVHIIMKTPWWVYASALTAIAAIDWSFFLEFVVYSVLKVILLLLGVWAVGVILFPITTIFTDLFSRKKQKEGDLKQSESL